MERELRIYVVGTSGVGKSTLGQRLAVELGLDHIELDKLYWGPDWTPRDEDEFRSSLNTRTAGPAWAVTGNYAMYRSDFLDRVTHVVWLNYSAIAIARQLIPRTFCRAWTGERMYGGCVETFRRSFFSRESILLWAVTTFRSNRRVYRSLFASSDLRSKERIELRSRHETKLWVESLSDEHFG